MSPRRANRLFITVATLAVALIACDPHRVFEDNKEIPGAIWKADQPVAFAFEVEDTVRLHNFYLNLRNGDHYPYMNIFVFVTMRFPNGRTSVDTLECFLADTRGKWLGSGLGDIYDNRILYREKKAFPIPGWYEIEINQAMRVADLPGIYDVGFRVSLAED